MALANVYFAKPGLLTKAADQARASQSR